MNCVMKVLNSNLIVKEIQAEVDKNGLIMKYDDANQYMFVKLVYDVPESLAVELGIETYKLAEAIFVIKRCAKIEFLDGCYIIDRKDLVAYLDKDEFKNIIGG